MPRGGPRLGAGGARAGAGRPRKPVEAPVASVDVSGPRPVFRGAEDFGVWALNASDVEVTMDQKLRAMQVLAMMAGKKADVATKLEDREAGAKAAMTGRFATRQVRGFGVVDGARN